MDKKNAIDPDVHIREAAQAGDFETVKQLFSRGASVDMALIGASATKQKHIQQWSIENGASVLWSFDQEPPKCHVSALKYSKNVSMLRGPGEVAKGTFQGEKKS